MFDINSLATSQWQNFTKLYLFFKINSLTATKLESPTLISHKNKTVLLYMYISFQLLMNFTVVNIIYVEGCYMLHIDHQLKYVVPVTLCNFPEHYKNYELIIKHIQLLEVFQCF